MARLHDEPKSVNGHDISNGIKHTVQNPKFWEVKLVHVIMLIGLFGGFAVWWSNFGALPRENSQSILEISRRQNEMDTRGQSGRITDEAQAGQIKDNSARIKSLEDNQAKILPAVTELTVKMNYLTALIEGREKQKK